MGSFGLARIRRALDNRSKVGGRLIAGVRPVTHLNGGGGTRAHLEGQGLLRRGDLHGKPSEHRAQGPSCRGDAAPASSLEGARKKQKQPR